MHDLAVLRHLRVTNFAILSDVAIDFAEGFNVLTGETGAGKSLIVEAVNLLRGGRASADIPRAGTSEATVEAIFELPADILPRASEVLAEAGLPDAGAEVLVRRIIHRGGRSRTYVNGALTTATRLAELGGMLVDLSGQHQHQGLVDPRRHRAILDAYAGAGELATAMAEAAGRVRAIRSEIDELSGDAAGLDERIDYLRFQLDELAAAAPTAGEDEALEQERAILLATERLASGSGAAEDLLYSGDGAAVDRLSAAAGELERLHRLDARLAAPLAQIEEARVLVEEAALALRAYAQKLEAQPERLAEVEDRLELLSRLKRKHGRDLAEVIARAEELARELARLSDREGRAAGLRRELAAATAEARAIAGRLTAARRAAGTRIVSEVEAALAELGMEAARLCVSIEPAELSASGADAVELMLASNRGEPAKPLARIASGGELSRIMLALKLVLRRADDVASYVFDEVDAGIGGATAEAVGHQIRAVADHRQVLCVTHLPQIAAFADAHFAVSKLEADGRTETRVRKLTDAQRRDEVARMLSGARLTKRARDHAGEIIANARR